MRSLREWLLKNVAAEFTSRGAAGINLKQLAGTSGLMYEQLREQYPDREALLLALVDEICDAHTEHVFTAIQSDLSSGERLMQLLARSMDFVDRQPRLANVIELALLGSNERLKERVYENYGRLFAQFIDDLLQEGVIQSRSRTVAADLTEVLLAVIFLGGSPVLQMDYLSFVDPRKVAHSTIDAMKRRYALGQYR